jgi:hypothetical protein
MFNITVPVQLVDTDISKVVPLCGLTSVMEFIITPVAVDPELEIDFVVNVEILIGSENIAVNNAL